jgi:hypothetical protein
MVDDDGTTGTDAGALDDSFEILGWFVVEDVVMVGGTGLELCERFRNGLFPLTAVMRLKIEKAVDEVADVGADDDDDDVVRCSIFNSTPC